MITSTLCHAILPRTDNGLFQSKLQLLKFDFGIDVRSEADMEVDVLWQHKDPFDLKKLSNDQLKTICKSYDRAFSNKKNDQLMETVLLGPAMNQSIREVEFF